MPPPPNKRPLADGDGEQHHIERDELAAMLANLRGDIMGRVEQGIIEVESRFLSAVGTRITQVEAEGRRQHAEHERKIAEINEKIAVLEAERPLIKARLETLTRGLATAEAASSQVPLSAGSGDDPNRSIDTTIIKIRTREPVSKREISRIVGGIVEQEMGLTPAAYEVVAEELSKYFVVKFKGAAGLGEARAKKFLQLQRVGADWRRLSAKDERNQDQPLFIDGDKSRRMVKTELITKRLAASLNARIKQQFFGRRSQGKVFHAWQPVARVLVQENAEDFTIEWNPAKVTELGIPREAITQEVRAAMAAEDVQWG